MDDFVGRTNPVGCLQLKDVSESQAEAAHNEECKDATRLVDLAPKDWLVNGKIMEAPVHAC
jgi:hypothetical protein